MLRRFDCYKGGSDTGRRVAFRSAIEIARKPIKNPKRVKLSVGRANYAQNLILVNVNSRELVWCVIMTRNASARFRPSLETL